MTKAKPEALAAAIASLAHAVRVIVLALRHVSPGAVADDCELAVEKRLRHVAELLGGEC